MADAPSERIQRMLSELDGAFLALAHWYLKALEGANDLPLDHSSTDVAAHLGISKATVVRFARRLGYSGFPEFRSALLIERAQRNHTARPEPHANSTLALLTECAINSLAAGLKTVDMHAYERVVALIAAAPVTVWFGTGDSAFVAGSADFKSTIGGIASRLVTDPPQMGIVAASLPKNSVVVTISQSGRWPAMANALVGCRERGVHLVCITSRSQSLLANQADYVLVTAAPDLTIDGHPFTIRAGPSILIDSLIVDVVKARGLKQVAFSDPRFVM